MCISFSVTLKLSFILTLVTPTQSSEPHLITLFLLKYMFICQSTNQSINQSMQSAEQDFLQNYYTLFFLLTLELNLKPYSSFDLSTPTQSSNPNLISLFLQRTLFSLFFLCCLLTNDRDECLLNASTPVNYTALFANQPINQSINQPGIWFFLPKNLAGTARTLRKI